MPNILEYKHRLQHLDKRRGRLHSPPSKYEKYNSSSDMDGYLSTLVRMEESDDLRLELESCSSKEPFLVLESSNHIFSESLSSGDDTDMVEMDMVDMDIGHGIHGHGGHGHG